MPSFALPLPEADIAALAWFVAVWIGYGYVVDRSRWRLRSLSRAMDAYRRDWIRTMADRDLRMVDTAIMTGLQNGTAFFASTSLLAIGAAFALLNTADEMLTMFTHLSATGAATRESWEIKSLGLLTVYAYAFFKFGWAYRLFNYASILLGAVPPRRDVDYPEGWAAVERTADMVVIAGRHFNLGLRAFFFSIGVLGWFAGPWTFIIATTVIVVVLARRQFFSDTFEAVRRGALPLDR